MKEKVGDFTMVTVVVTPETARAWLDNLSAGDNRKLAKSVVNKYAAAMMAGAWRDYDAMWVVTEDGKVLDGQHRAAAVAQSGVSVGALVKVVPAGTSVHDLRVDQGMSRSAAFVLGSTGRNVGVARYLLHFVTGTQSAGVDEVARVLHRIQPQLNELSAGSHRRGVTVAPLIAAWAFSMWLYEHDADVMARQFSGLASGIYDGAFWPGVRSAARQTEILYTSKSGASGGTVSAGRHLIFLKVCKALSREGRLNEKITFKGTGEAYEEALRPLVAKYIGVGEFPE